MFWTKREPEKPNYVKIVGITLAIIAGVAAAGYAAYLYCKKKGIHCCICKSGEAEEDFWDDELEDEIDDEIETEMADDAAEEAEEDKKED